MANPQKELGHTQIANDVMEALISSSLSGTEFRILLFIIRKTWGWHKKEDKISISQVVTETTLSRKTVCECLNRLVTKRLLVKEKGRINKLKFNKDYEIWLVTERLQGSYRNNTRLVTETTPKLVTEMTPTKEKKETITKETIQK